MIIRRIALALSMLLFASLANAVTDAEMLASMKALTRLVKAYEATPSRCPGGHPAYMCSGFMLHGTRQDLPEGQGAWEPDPPGRTLDASFIFARDDIHLPMRKWGYSNGFIIAAPEELSVNCFYPVEASSDKHAGNGCGSGSENPSTYSLCEVLPAQVLSMDPLSEAYRWTLEQLAQFWLDWDQEHAGDTARRRCAYRLDDAEATQRFEIAQIVVAKASQTADLPNDLRIQTWNPGYDPRLPIKAFFFIEESARDFAERDRDMFLKATGIRLPVLQLTFGDDLEIGFSLLD